MSFNERVREAMFKTSGDASELRVCSLPSFLHHHHNHRQILSRG